MMTRPPNQHPGHPYWVRGCESCSGRMSPVSHQCQRDNQVRFRTLRRLQSQPHNQSNFAFVPLSLFLCFPFHLSHLYLLVEMLSTASRNFYRKHRSFNFMNAEGLHLSNQEYSVSTFFPHHPLKSSVDIQNLMQVCIRSERGFCGISYTACADMVNKIIGFSDAEVLKGCWSGSQPVREFHSERGWPGWRRATCCQGDPSWFSDLWPKVGGWRVYNGLGGDSLRNDQHCRQLEAGCGIHSGSFFSLLIRSWCEFRHMCWSPVWGGFLLGDLVGSRHQLLLPLPSLQLHQTIHSQVQNIRWTLGCRASPQASLWQWRGNGRLPGKGVVTSKHLKFIGTFIASVMQAFMGSVMESNMGPVMGSDMGSVMGSVIGLVMGMVRRSQCQKSLFVAPPPLT